MFAVEPSEYVPITTNCWVAPVARIAGVAGDIEMEDNVGAAATTVKLTGGLVKKDRVAVIFEVPAATPVAKPVESIVAVSVLSLAQVT